jgi:hypothetical protein
LFVSVWLLFIVWLLFFQNKIIMAFNGCFNKEGGMPGLGFGIGAAAGGGMVVSNRAKPIKMDRPTEREILQQGGGDFVQQMLVDQVSAMGTEQANRGDFASGR